MTQTGINFADIWAQLQGRVRFALELILVVWLALSLAKLAWLIIAPSARVAMQLDRPLPTPLQAEQARLSANRAALMERNPFISAALPEVVEAPETQLNLKLVGLLMSTSEGGGSAQITTPDNRTQRYVPGQDILEGVTLERVLSDRVIIRRNGATEVLMRFGRSAGLSVVGDASQTLPESAANSAQAGQPVEGIVADPEVLMRTVRLTPDQRGGEVVGYKMQLIGSAATLNRAGLEDGDVLIEVNGTRVVDIDFSEIMDEMNAVQTASLGIERDGVAQTIRLRFGE